MTIGKNLIAAGALMLAAAPIAASAQPLHHGGGYRHEVRRDHDWRGHEVRWGGPRHYGRRDYYWQATPWAWGGAWAADPVYLDEGRVYEEPRVYAEPRVYRERRVYEEPRVYEHRYYAPAAVVHSAPVVHRAHARHVVRHVAARCTCHVAPAHSARS